MITVIAIIHTRADGTFVESDERIPQAAVAILKAWPGNFRWFPSLHRYGVRNTRDKAAARWKIDRVAETLRAAGFDVGIQIGDDERRPFAVIEAERNERAAERAERRTELADKRRGEAAAAYEASKDAVEGIPMGQPILTGHHSQRQHERALDRSHNLMGESSKLDETAVYHAYRAETAARYQEHREDIPRTLRRIERLEAQVRRLERTRNPEAVASDLAETREELEYWRGIVAQAEVGGHKMWGPADFRKGDFVQTRNGWAEVERVNPKSLSLPTEPGWNRWKLAYGDVLNRMSAEEMASARAEAKARQDAEAQQ